MHFAKFLLLTGDRFITDENFCRQIFYQLKALYNYSKLLTFLQFCKNKNEKICVGMSKQNEL